MPNILVVEDDIVSAHVLSMQLENLGYFTTSIVDDHESAIAAATKDFIDCAIVDINLHGSPIGIEIAKDIRKIGNCPVVFLTSYNNTKVVMQTAAAMPYGYLNKPCRVDDLHTTITIAIQKHRLEILERQAVRKQQELYRFMIQQNGALLHDLKTPLTSITLGLSSLENHPKIDLIKRAVSKALDIIKQVSLTDDEAMPMPTPQTLCLIKYTNSIIQETLIITERKCPIALVSEFDHLQIQICENSLWQILTNLIQNAVKYSLPAQPIEVMIGRQAQNLIIEVSDQGIGIPEQSLDKIFDFNYRAPNTGEITGDGIGLYGVQQAIQALNGEIKVNSVVDQGSVFAVTLPLF